MPIHSLAQHLTILLSLCLPLLAEPADTAAPPPPIFPGVQPDGSVLLPNQWSLRPAGRHLALGDFPVNIALHPDGRFAAILHCGHGDHEIIVVDLRSNRIISRTHLDEAFYGIAFAPDGATLYSSGCGDEVVHRFAFKNGHLTDAAQLRVRPARERGIPGGLALDPKRQTLWVANVWGHSLSCIDLEGARPVFHFPLTDALRSTTNLVVPPADPDLAAATKRDEAKQDPSRPTDPYPYACVVDPHRDRLYASLWGKAQVAVVDIESRQLLALWSTEEHPNEMILAPSGKTLYVANANRNTVSAIDPDTGRARETLVAALYPAAPPGSTPNSLALTPDETLLFVANACNNNVAVFDVSRPGESRSLGFIPVGWYPTSVRVTPDGRQLVVANGKGLVSRSNRHGPQPGRAEMPATIREYIGGLMRGTLSTITLPAPAQRDRQLRAWTEQAYRCSPLQQNAAAPPPPSPDNPIPARPGDPSPIRYCLYILKENRTYDQVLGDLPQGNGDPALCLFPETVTPNHHALAREFVLLDNFYVESEVSADGHEWSMGAYATDYVEKTWPLSYGHNKSGKFSYPSEGKFRIAWPAGGYLWDRAREAGITYRSYGEFVDNGATSADPATTKIPALIGHIDPGFRGWDMDYLDQGRTDRFLAELHRFEAAGDMPQLQILRLPNDHTYGTSAGKRTPRAMVADNDLALGRLIEGLSRSKFWPQTAVFVVEDDAQNGPDHVDAHRTVAFVLSPYTRRGAVDSTVYSTCSMLRTIELILGLKPMSQFDAAARPMYNAFHARPDPTPYQARPANVDLDERNTALAWGAQESSQMDFTREDAADDLRLNEVVWRSVRGPNHPMPPPVRAAFVRATNDED
ncbi:MAG TPA: alkaline phosphatase family protein [Verrucomicrobiota bacterium]|nr:alkaline phosphatase family protein [Verrucomicrobiota bacterium]HNU50563.1 alkaline phosphatase family protein [Verrucomicrobiota bacterium]